MKEVYIGLMSGTSLDGIDAIAIDFSQSVPETLAWRYIPFDTALKQTLDAMLQPGWQGTLHDLGHIDALLGEAYATAVNLLIEESDLSREVIHAIGSHGQTAFHSPDSSPAFSMQLGDPNRIAHLTGITVVSDFRRRDIAAGGQGAPLVPAFHKDIFYSPSENRVILNIGGIANITHLSSSQPIAGFDTGPGNILMDTWIHRHKQVEFDRDGRWAASGQVNEELLAAMLRESFFQLPPPKSTGRELFNLDWLQQFPGIDTQPAEDVQATLAELTARSISNAIHHYAPDTEAVYVCGGGAYNKHLMARLQATLDGCRLADIKTLGLEAERIEAMAFAWLARRTMMKLHGNLPEVTGAEKELILGGIYQK
jgi:anhydro-N-acetylmuramic acid kinase